MRNADAGFSASWNGTSKSSSVSTRAASRASDTGFAIPLRLPRYGAGGNNDDRSPFRSDAESVAR